MPRYARKKSSTQIYHVMLRGNNRDKIFVDAEDKSRIIDIIRNKKMAGEYFLFAYCVMDNHIHLIIKENQDTISRVIKRITTSYSIYFNKKYMRIGHVFQERFRSEEVENERYLLAVIRYVHQNPYKAGIGVIDGYKWSSYNDYFSRGENIADTEDILNIFSNSREKALIKFAIFNIGESEEEFLDIYKERELSVFNVTEYINKYLAEKKLDIIDLKKVENGSLRNELIANLLEKSDLSKRGIAVLLGLNREMVRKATLSRDLSQ